MFDDVHCKSSFGSIFLNGNKNIVIIHCHSIAYCLLPSSPVNGTVNEETKNNKAFCKSDCKQRAKFVAFCRSSPVEFIVTITVWSNEPTCSRCGFS